MEGKQFRALVMSACQMCVRWQDRVREEGAEAGGMRETKVRFMSSCVEAGGYVLWSIDCDTFHPRLRM